MINTAVRRTALYDAHVACGGRMVDFAGWSMPVQYAGVIAEHNAVRTAVGIFDVSHMGEIEVRGASAAAELQRLLSNDIDKLVDDTRAQYTLLTNARGGIEDDLIVYRIASDHFLLVVNAANTDHDFAWIQDHVGQADIDVRDVSADFAMLAVQGPETFNCLATVLGNDVATELADAKPFRHRTIFWRGEPIRIATTGYTGERGVELLIAPALAVALWDELAGNGGATPCGLAARDTLRLEACYPLHGNDIDADTSAIAAGLGWVCKLDTGFSGADALRGDKTHGTSSVLCALELISPGIARAGCELLADNKVVGSVTSGTMSPTLGKAVAMGYVDTQFAQPGSTLDVEIRGKLRTARIVTPPFYRREDVTR